MTRGADGYDVLQPVLRGGMLLAPLRDAPGEASWTVGVRFAVPPPEPVEVHIRDGYEDAEPRPFLGVPPIVRDDLLAVLRGAGVDNLDVYDAVLRSRDGAVRIAGYKAFNLIGLVDAVDRGQGRRMFRLAEDTSAILVHRSVRDAIEAAGIGPLRFVAPADHLS